MLILCDITIEDDLHGAGLCGTQGSRNDLESSSNDHSDNKKAVLFSHSMTSK